MTEVYFDESGFTGADLLQRDQPVFVSASTRISADEAQSLLDETIGSKADEISHKRILRSAGGEKRVVNFISRLVTTSPDAARYYLIDKRFALLAKLIDNWIEPTMHRDNLNLYAEGGARSYANMMYYCLPGFIGLEVFNGLLAAYQRFSREWTPTAFEGFFNYVGRLIQHTEDEEGRELLSQVFYGSSLGAGYLKCLDRASSDIALPSIFRLIAHWDDKIGGPFVVVHDESKNVEEFRWRLQVVMGATETQELVGLDGAYTYRLPFRAQRVTLAPSEDHPQLQVADLIAGAAAALGRHVVDRSYRPDYARALVDAGLETLCIGMMWPDLDDIAKRRPPAPPEAKNPLDVIAKLFRDKETENNADLG